MKRLIAATLTASALWGFFGENQARAQFGTYTPPATAPYYYPAVSPYLNILQGGAGGAGIGYFTLTQPQIQTGNQLLQLQNQTNLLNLQQQALLNRGGLIAPGLLGTGLGTPGLTSGLGGLTTGHPVLFNSTGTYYNSQPVRPLTSVTR